MNTTQLTNRFTYSNFVQYLLLSRQYERAEEFLAQSNVHPEDQLLYWIQLSCLIEQVDRVIEHLVPLLKAEPENPYFRLGALEALHHTTTLSKEHLIIRYERIRQAAKLAPSAHDVLSKLAYSASIKGLWSLGLSYFVESINSIALATQQQVVLLSPKNARSLSRFLKHDITIMDGLAIDDSPNSTLTFDSVPDTVLSRAMCILVTANEMELPEATFLIAKLASRHPELSRSEKSPMGMVTFAIRHSPGWIGLRLPYSKEPIIHWN